MTMTIYQAHDLSVDLMRKGETKEAAIYHALQHEIDYPHDAEAMLMFWHDRRITHNRRGYPRFAQ